MTIVVKLGGTNGSGKSSVARALLAHMKFTEKDLQSLRPEHVKSFQGYGAKIDGLKWYVLGCYKNTCGGMDAVTDKEKRLSMIRSSLGLSDVVFFEGLITGKTYGEIGALSERPPHKWIYAFMDTPFNVCVQRVTQRRTKAAALVGKVSVPLDAERTMRPTYKSVVSVAKRAAERGHVVLWLPHNHEPSRIADYLISRVSNGV